MALDIIGIVASPVAIGFIAPSLVVLIFYLIYKYSIAEKTFEQAVEDEKRRQIQEELSKKPKTVKKKTEFKKSWANKKKEKVEQEVVQPVIEVIPPEEKKDPEPEVVEPKETKPVKQKKSKANNSTGPNQVPEVTEKAKKNSPDAAKPSPETKKVKTPETVEKGKSVEKVKPVEKMVEVKASESVKTVNEVKKELVTNPPTQNAVSKGMASKKKNKEVVDKDMGLLNATKLFAHIKEIELDTEEIQNLIDILLNKQKDSAGWTKKRTDQLTTTKKSLEEKSQLLDQEQKTTQAVTSKLKEVREECNALRVKEKASLEKINRHQQEVQALNVRVKQLQEQLTATTGKEKSNQIVKEKTDASVKKLEEENIKLKEKLSKLETERSGVTKAEFEALKKSKDDLQKVHTLLIEQHTGLISSQKSDTKHIHAQVEDSKHKLDEANKKNATLLKEKQTLSDSLKVIEDKLKTEQNLHIELDAQVKQLNAKVAEFNRVQTEIKELRLENERLTEQLVSTKERVAGDGQEVIHQNGEMNGKMQDHEAIKSLAEKDKIIKEKETLLAQISDDLTKQKARNDALNEEIEAQKQKNNELREKNWKAMDALSNAEKNADQKVKEIQTTLDQKLLKATKEHEEKLQHLTASTGSSGDQSERLKKAENEAAQRLLDYNNECAKTKQLQSEITRLNSDHKIAQSRIEEIEKTVKNLNSELHQNQLITRQHLLRMCPNVSIDNSLPHDKWLQEFEKQTSSFVLPCDNTQQANLEQLLKEKEHLEKEYLEKQRHYDRVLAETESTLQNLQSSAESQEALWQERLSQKQLELDQILSEKNALLADKDAMQSTFQQISQLKELQEKLELLQKTLETAESERSQIEQKYDEVQKNCLNLSDQLENKEKLILEFQKEKSSSKSLTDEIADLKAKLEAEKAVSKNFSSQMVKLTSLVKIGQDSLNEEQEMVKKLKSQLEAYQVSNANGNSSTVPSSIAINNESRPKTKGSDKSKKKMDASVKK